MKHIHPFPARMAPEIALERLSSLPTNSVVLDPMSGSGMVLSQASRNGIMSIGCDLDPLARLISRVASTYVREKSVWKAYRKLMHHVRENEPDSKKLNWIENDVETTNFIKYWFDEKQEVQLRNISSYFSHHSSEMSSNAKNVLKVALSRLIITKEPKASLARDTAHSRPHKTILVNNFDVLEEYEGSIKHVLSALNAHEIRENSKTYLADARNMSKIKDECIDSIITSPPYLNAIDYMRGHKFSLIWMGYKLSSLRALRSSAIGAEAGYTYPLDENSPRIFCSLGLDKADDKTKRLVNRYYIDLRRQIKESFRVLKSGGSAIFVVGNSSIKGSFIRNSEILKIAAAQSGFTMIEEAIRTIPDNRRYLPVAVSESNSLFRRMRTEHILEFRKSI